MKGKCCVCVASVLSLIAAMVIGLIMVVNNSEDIWINRELSSLATTSVKQLPQEIQKWHAKGHYVKINGFNLFYILLDIRKKVKNKTKGVDSVDPGKSTLILIHGFPTSTFDYHRAIDKHLIPQLQEKTGDHIYSFYADVFSVISCK